MLEVWGCFYSSAIKTKELWLVLKEDLGEDYESVIYYTTLYRKTSNIHDDYKKYWCIFWFGLEHHSLLVICKKSKETGYCSIKPI